jgi:DNA processing protein
MKTLKLSEGNYPVLLREIFDPPAILYAEGHVGALAKPCVAIVGTRRCTPYGEAVAFEFGRALARAGVCVVSGLAFGIDAAAHRGALEGGGVTAAVIAQPLQNLMPVKHRALAREIVEKGGVILSEKAPGMETFKGDYLVRNRIIAGLSKATVVVEAGFPSGALNTASHAGRENREVFAVPGRLSDLMSAGCNSLVAKGEARLVLTPGQVLEFLEMKEVKRAELALEGLERKLVDLVREEPRHVSELADLCGVAFGELYETLSNLEMKGVVWMAADQRYAVCGG